MVVPMTLSETSGQTPPKRRARWPRLLLAAIVIWFFGDFCYSCYVGYRIRQWKASVPWTADGLAPDAAEREKGEGGVALLMVHGFGDSPQMYRKLLPELANHDYYCKAILLPGFGKDVETYAASEVEDWLRKVKEEMAALKESHRQVWIVAHSLGGAISINHCLNQQDSGSDAAMPDGLLLLAPAIEVSNQRSPIFPTRFWHEWSKYALPSSRITCSPFPMDARDPAEQEREYRNIFSPRSIVTNTFTLIDANRGRASELSLPTLVVLAKQDRVVDSAATEKFFEQIGGPDKELLRLEQSGHNVPVDVEWETVTDAIKTFLAEHPPS